MQLYILRLLHLYVTTGFAFTQTVCFTGQFNTFLLDDLHLNSIHHSMPCCLCPHKSRVLIENVFAKEQRRKGGVSVRTVS